MAEEVGIIGGLTEAHWRVIRFIRGTFDQINQCPLIYVACKKNDIGLGDLKKLFPSGWLRGACKLAGVTYREGYMQHMWLEGDIEHHVNTYNNRVYDVDEQGFLTSPAAWDENFAVQTAYEMKIPGNLTDRHWQIIRYLREYWEKRRAVPTIYETCEYNSMDLGECERLFPGGYHRGAVRLAGLHAVDYPVEEA
jgi:tRNA 2-thiouridine synthesizing protein E